MIIGISPILVRLSETGPVTTAFYRLFLALPWLWILMHTNNKITNPARMERRDLVLAIVAALCFSTDIALWHGSIMLTSVANATVLANLAPVFVSVAAWWLFHEYIGMRFVVGLVLGIGGVVMLTVNSLEVSQDHLLGDLLGVMTAIFYAAYLLITSRLRRRYPTWQLMTLTALVATAYLFMIAWLMEDQLLPQTLNGWIVLLVLAVGSQVIGQGLITYALAHLPISFSSLSLLMQPLVAALLAWWLFEEVLMALQLFGVAAILSAIVLARRRKATAQPP